MYKPSSETHRLSHQQKRNTNVSNTNTNTNTNTITFPPWIKADKV
jgi:hypothetical protein